MKTKCYFYILAMVGVVVLVLFGLDAFFGSIDTPPDHFASVRDATPDPVNVPTSYTEAAEAHARSAASAVGFGTGWLIVALLIVILNPASFLMPGSMLGSARMEKAVEGFFMTTGGLFFMWLAAEAGFQDLATCALLVNVLPGVLLLIWAALSSSEEGKFLLLLPLVVMGFWLCAQIIAMLVLGLVFAPIMTFGILAIKLFLFALLFGGEEEGRAARA